MDSDLALRLTSEMIWVAVLVAAPILGLVLIVGVLVSILQVVTQIQEMSLAFVPKLIAAVVAVVVFGPWMLRKVVEFASGAINNAAVYGLN
jgi:flagellar biosynthesis protein FliQ